MEMAEREYYILSDTMAILPGKENVEHYGFDVENALEYDWQTGVKFADDHRPKEPIKLQVTSAEDEEEGEPVDPVGARLYPDLSFYPIPLMSRKMVDFFRQAGVNNLETFETEIINPPKDNKPEKDMYFAVNVVGLFKSENISKEALIFRLVGGESFIIVRKTLKQKADQAGMTKLTWSPVKIQPSIANADGTIERLPLITLP